MNYQYNYDKMDNIMDKATEHGDYAYDYDDIYCLIDADNPTLDDEAFAYDPVGNRLTAEGVAGTWTYNANNELTGYDDVSYVYDVNGNMTQKTFGGVVTKFFYNTEDRLIRVEEGDGTLIAVYYYDPFGRRLWKEVSGARTYFFYADEGLIGEYDASGLEIRSYGYKPGSTWTTDPLFMKENGNFYFYHNDHLGTPQKLTSTNGAVVWSATYTSFGEATDDASSTITNPLRFPGQYYDEETGLHHNLHRYYDSNTGRYLTPDPLGLDDGINLFTYVESNPVNLMDFLGLFKVPTHGKWCGPWYGGGKKLQPGEKPDWTVEPEDDLDACCYIHDKCYDKNNVTADTEPGSCEKLKCDKEMTKCLKGLPQDPARWALPPKTRPNSPITYPRMEPLEYGHARAYKSWAIALFEYLISRGKK